MSRQYSIPTVLRMVPNCLLKAFFAQLGYDDPEFPWSRLGEREISPMIRWIGLLPRHAQKAVDGHFHQVFNLSCHAGVETLFEAAAACGELNLAADMPRDVGFYAKAMWALLHRKVVFDMATRLHQIKHIAWWRKRWDLPRRAPDMSDVALARLKHKISDLLTSTQGRGHACTVDTLSRSDGTDYFMAYPDDFVWNFFSHDNDGLLSPQAACPTFSIVFAYRRDEGSLELYGKIPADLKRQLEEFFAEEVLGAKLGPWDPQVGYEIDHLKDRAFRLETSPEDQLRVSIQEMCLTLKNSGRQISVSVNVDDPFDNIHRALDECLNKENVPLSDVIVTRVTFCFDFLPFAGRMAGRVRFDVGRSNMCTLRNELPDHVELILKYLRLWKVDRARRIDIALAPTGT
jgi:hypothetical protein